MKKTIPLKIASAALLAASLLSCQKEVGVSPNTATPGKSKGQDIAANYSFDWENATTMPVSASSPVVYVPWQSQGGTPLDPGIVNDYHKSDGWDLIFDSFAPDNFPNSGDRGAVATSNAQPSGGLYFALYNRFRGIIRYYMYVPPGLFGSSTQLEHGLQIYSANGSTSKMLNFESGEIVNADNNTSGFTKANKDGIPTTGGWYAMQYQIAFDPNFAGTSFPNLGFKWDTYSVSVNQINLNGTEVGSTKGTITTPQPDFNWANATVNLGLGIAEVFLGGIPAGAAGNNGFTALQQAAQGGLSGSVSGLLNGIFGGNSANTQTVDLTMNSTITTTGTGTTSQIYESNSLRFPGQTNSGMNGVAPLVSYPLGLFNLPARPVVRADYSGDGVPHSNQLNDFYYTYQVDANAIKNSLQQNLSVINTTSTGAQIANFNAEVLVLDLPSNWDATGRREVIGNHVGYAGSSVSTHYSSYAYKGVRSGQVTVRVSFNVVPNTPVSGRAPIFIVKTFTANVVF